MPTYTDPADLPAEMPKWTARDVRAFAGVTVEGLPEEQAVILALFTSRRGAPGQRRKVEVLPAVMPLDLARELAENLLKMVAAVERAGPGTGPLQ